MDEEPASVESTVSTSLSATDSPFSERGSGSVWSPSRVPKAPVE